MMQVLQMIAGEGRLPWRRPVMGLGFVALATWLLRDGSLSAAEWVDVMQWVVPAFLLAEGLPAAMKPLSRASAQSVARRIDVEEP